MEQNGETQKSLTDPEAKLMKFKGDYNVGYNVQTAVDSKHHLISEFEVTNHPSDHGLIGSVAGKVKQVFNLDILETTEDKGYRDKKDMVDCLEQGIVPNVHPTKAFACFELETLYEPSEVSLSQKQSVAAQDLKVCLRAGVIPEAYKGFVRAVSVVEVGVFEDVVVGELPVFESEVQRVEYARGGFFVRDLERNVVYCPGGEKLRFCGSFKRGGFMHYCNKLGCERCLVKCCGSKFLMARFGVGQVVVACRSFGRKGVRWRVRRRVGVCRVVRFKFFPDGKKLDSRKCLSEHPFGSVKFWNDGSCLLLRGLVKVSGELSLSFLAYNMKRAISVLGVDRIMKALVVLGSFLCHFLCHFLIVAIFFVTHRITQFLDSLPPKKHRLLLPNKQPHTNPPQHRNKKQNHRPPAQKNRHRKTNHKQLPPTLHTKRRPHSSRPHTRLLPLRKHHIHNPWTQQQRRIRAPNKPLLSLLPRPYDACLLSHLSRIHPQCKGTQTLHKRERR